ncbi:feruloyl esterase b precursor [Apiospora phragmitis]|uniref:Feruloyl esterase b n=1 Tax=Apiospora phragmitis TaxID=2905665 RepID=A0ABR1TQ23_9PEZI
MCGRYSLGLRPAQVRQMLQQDNMPVEDAPEDEGDNAPRQSYNFAPGYHGIVYRADTPDWGAGPHRHAKKAGDGTEAADEVADQVSSTFASVGDGSGSDIHYKLQSMKWGLIPFWTKRNPDYGSMMKTINCRDDSLAQGGGMWNTMKARKRCIVVAQGFYEWLKKDGGREKIPHFVKRKDGALMCFAGLWDCVQYEGLISNCDTDDDKKHYTYTIITTDSNKQLKFLHDRMPVILNNGSEELRTWLDPKRYEWSKDLQSLLKPFEGELEVYPVSKDVGKVGNNSPTFLIPIDSKENKSNIANFFGKGTSNVKTKTETSSPPQKQPEVKIKKEAGFVEEGSRDDTANDDDGETQKREDGKHAEDDQAKSVTGVKREAEEEDISPDEPPKKTAKPTPKAESWNQVED